MYYEPDMLSERNKKIIENVKSSISLANRFTNLSIISQYPKENIILVKRHSPVYNAYRYLLGIDLDSHTIIAAVTKYVLSVNSAMKDIEKLVESMCINFIQSMKEVQEDEIIKKMVSDLKTCGIDTSNDSTVYLNLCRTEAVWITASVYGLTEPDDIAEIIETK